MIILNKEQKKETYKTLNKINTEILWCIDFLESKSTSREDNDLIETLNKAYDLIRESRNGLSSPKKVIID